MAVTGAIGTVVTTALPGSVVKVAIPWTSDAAAGSVSEIGVALPAGTLFQVVTDPGATAPTDNYDITLLSAIGDAVDWMGGAGTDRDTANTEISRPVITVGSTLKPPYLDGGTYYPTIAAAGNSKVGTLYLYIARGQASL